MKVLVVGANGKIGRHVVRLLKDNEQFQPKAMVRKPEQFEELQQQEIEAVEASLEGTVMELAEAAKGCDAVVFTAGSGGHTGADKTLLIDLDGAVKMAEAAEQAGISRFILISALQANNRRNWSKQIKPYYVAKHYADRSIMQTSLNYTIIRPGLLVDDSGTGLVKCDEETGAGPIPREDVARVIVASLNEKATFKKAFDIISGSDPIENALQKL